VIVNAFSGKFEEVGAFGEFVGFIEQTKAVEVAAKALKLNTEAIKDVYAEVVFIPCDLSYLRIFPLYKPLCTNLLQLLISIRSRKNKPLTFRFQWSIIPLGGEEYDKRE
jgi:hypothetical protein